MANYDDHDEDQFLRFIIANDQSQDFIERYNLDHVPEWYQYKRMHEKQMEELGLKDDFWASLDGNMPLKQLLTKMLVHAMDEVAKEFK